MENLLAKSNPKVTLHQHIDDCLHIHDFLSEQFAHITALKGVPDKFWEYVKISIIFHDLGKAHSEFQKILNGKPHKWKSQRHELFSLPFFSSFDGIETNKKKIIQLAIAGHHKDFDKLYERYISGFYQEGDDDEFDFGSDDEKITYEEEFSKVDKISVIQLIKKYYEIKLGDKVGVTDELRTVDKYLYRPIDVENENYWFLTLLFGAIKNCDHLGSAQVQGITNVVAEDFAFLEAKQKGLQLKGFDFYAHQKSCSEVTGNVILTAPTGSGKTESAFLWIRKHFKEGKTGRIFYVLPFTASINAMFERLSDEISSSDKVGMLHGKLGAYLNDYFEEHQYSQSTKKEAIDDLKQKFKYVTTPVKVCTPFQLLKHIFGLKGFEQGMFEWVNAFFIFDEIHAYDAKTFAQIKVLLEFVTTHLGVKVMVMTATMPTFLSKEIESAIGKFTPIKADDELYKKFQRHRVRLMKGLLGDNLKKIEISLKRGNKVLVVCNTVKEAQKVYKKLQKHARRSVLLHGRFNATDRNAYEQTLIRSEKSDIIEDINLLVGTQAIEVSLDIDFDVIYSEPAPIDALIQRFGRVNRKREKGISNCFVFNENNESDFYVYDKDVIERTIKVFERNDRQIIDESILQKYIDEVYPDWSQKQNDEFNNTYEIMKSSLKTLIPLCHSKKREEDFYKMFDGAKVLPQIYEDKFKEFLKKFDFISAENLKVSIRKNRLGQWLSEGYVRKKTFAYEKNKKGDLLEINYLITNKVYHSKSGLNIEEHEIWNEETIW
jgi:CRISPR-associated endonuclease/helicase Cas3